MIDTGPRLVIVCGLPGAGKTTLATRLAAEVRGIRFCPDEWMAKLGIDIYDSGGRDRIESLQWDVAQAVLKAGGVAIIEWGTWSREERDRLRNAARALGAAVELHVLDESIDVLWERLEQRRAESPRIELEDLRQWSGAFQRPTPDEKALFDPPTS